MIQAGESVPPKVELRLAKLYKVAFARQQQRHLGILPKDIRYRRDALSNSTDPDIEVKIKLLRKIQDCREKLIISYLIFSLFYTRIVPRGLKWPR